MQNRFNNWAKKRKWNLLEGHKSFPTEIFERYHNFPQSWLSFIDGYSLIMNEEENIWFLTADNFYPKEENEWRYNEFEIISLNATDDEDLQNQVKQFWNNHLPIIMSVGDGYEYFAIELNSGNIVSGFEPEFEEIEIVADNFEQFLDMIISDKIFL